MRGATETGSVMVAGSALETGSVMVAGSALGISSTIGADAVSTIASSIKGADVVSTIASSTIGTEAVSTPSSTYAVFCDGCCTTFLGKWSLNSVVGIIGVVITSVQSRFFFSTPESIEAIFIIASSTSKRWFLAFLNCKSQ